MWHYRWKNISQRHSRNVRSFPAASADSTVIDEKDVWVLISVIRPFVLLPVSVEMQFNVSDSFSMCMSYCAGSSDRSSRANAPKVFVDMNSLFQSMQDIVVPGTTPSRRASHIETFSQFHNSVLTNFYINDNTCLNEYNNEFILEYNYPNTSIDLALATIVHYGLRSL